ncbi:MAG: nucleotidyltransferase family protein [Flavobacteriales bacterium]
MEKHIISSTTPIKDALRRLNELPHIKGAPLLLLVVDDNKKLVGTLTDGDIRRGLIEGADLFQPLERVMNKDFSYVQHKTGLSQLNALKKKGIWAVPLLDNDFRVIDLINLNLRKSILPIDVVIMAGGRGERLYPLTKNTPKPMLKVGEKPIIEINIDRLVNYGVRHINISVNYLSDVITSYFQQKDKGCTISFVKENQPLGTLGSITLVDKFEEDYILLMNSDLLTDIDFEDLLSELIQHKADMIVASVPYRVSVPYAVLETQGKEIKKLSEKPTYTYHSNGGIYLFKKEILKYVPENSYFNATDLLQVLLDNNHKVIYYDLIGYWLDIGSPEDFEKAQADILHLKL